MPKEYEVFYHNQFMSEGKRLVVKFNSPKEDIDGFITILMAEIKKDIADFTTLKETCYELVCRLPIPIFNQTESFILRARPNNNDEMFSTGTQIAHNTERPDLIQLGRFNLENEGVFYGTLPISSSEVNGQMVTICEAYKDMFDSNNKALLKRFTMGKWMVTEPFPLVMLTFYDVALTKSSHVQNINPPYQDFLDKSLSDIDKAKCESFFKFFSECAGKRNDSDNNYKLTTAFFHALRMYYGEKIGICYSSSMTDNFGLNVVLTPHIVKHCLKLDSVVMFKWVPDFAVSKSAQTFPCSIPAFADKDGNFIITNYF